MGHKGPQGHTRATQKQKGPNQVKGLMKLKGPTEVKGAQS